jgi:co-chaperonin GroES (HSP10)
MNVRPLHDRILVHRLEAGERHVGGIIIPDTAKEKALQGTAIVAGTGKTKTMASGSSSTSKRATGSCSANMLARRSRATARSTSS